MGCGYLPRNTLSWDCIFGIYFQGLRQYVRIYYEDYQACMCSARKHAYNTRKCTRACNIFLTVHNLGVGRKMKVDQKGPIHTRDFRTSADLRARSGQKREES